MIQGVIFDMDGVLADSEELICEAAMAMFAEHGVEVQPEDFVPWVGTGEDTYLGKVAEQYGVPLVLPRDKERTYALYGEIIKGRLKALPGAHAFIEACRRRGLGMALATSADRSKMLSTMAEIQIPLESFDATVTGSDVERKKPHPDIFLKATESSGWSPRNCLVVEDSVSGLEAAKAAGCRVLALTTTNPAPAMAKADWIAEDLSDAPSACLNW